MLGSYETFKEQVLRLSNIDLNAYKERQMKRRIEALIRKNDIHSYDDYIIALRTDKDKYTEFINYITINVSEFFRNVDQWRLLEDEILPYLFENFGKRLKIWSAACSTGDEPYSLAMVLSKYIPLSNIKIIATDIDKQVLEKAKVGLYNVKSLAGLPEEFLLKYFTKINDRTYQISDNIKSCVDFSQHNLLRDEYPKNCDLIVCRNVLIYFTEETKDIIYKKFYKSLKQDGILFVGSTEQIIQPQLIGFSPYRSFFYKKTQVNS